MNTTLNRDKYINSILYLTKYCNNNYLGAVKLNKLLYYLDFISYRDKGKTVTGDNYIHLNYGPVPVNAETILSQMKEDGSLVIEANPYKDTHKKSFVPTRMIDTKIFNKYEMSLLERVCQLFSSWSTDKIVDQTHLEAPWFYSEPFELIDFEYAHDIDIDKEYGGEGLVG